ncbi:MAG: RNA polymerase sigma factor [Actinomycetota bacterium]
MDTGAKRAPRDAEDNLLLAAARGDAAALRELYRAFERPLYTLGIRWLHEAQLAEELVQEVTVRIWRRAGTFDPSRGAAGSWIFGMARNVASDLARARLRQPVPVSEIVEETEPWDQDAAWQGWQVTRAMRRLPIEQQRILELAYVHSYTQSEIASTLGIPLGTVKTRLYKALKTLRASFEEMGIVEGIST